MAEKWMRIPIANSVVKLSSVEYVTPIVPYERTGKWGFRLVYNNYTTIPLRFAQANNAADVAAANAVANATPFGVVPSNQVENGFNATVFSTNTEILETIRNDIINVLTDNGVNLINNFPDL